MRDIWRHGEIRVNIKYSIKATQCVDHSICSCLSGVPRPLVM